MGFAPDAKLVIKRTFLEFIENNPSNKDARIRAQTDSALMCGAYEQQDMSAQESDEAVTDDDLDGRQALLPSDLTYAGGQQPTSLELGQWFPGSIVPLMTGYDASCWHPAGSWWVPTGFAMDFQTCSAPAALQGSYENLCSSTTSPAFIGSSDRSRASADASSDENLTTVMLRNLPNNYTRDMLLELLDSEGFACNYDFVYLPIDFNSQAGLGYAFVNLLSPADAQRFWKHFDGFDHWALPSDKVCCLNWSSPHQGLHAHVERYRNSPVMHEGVSDECKPMIFMDGVRIPFPAPTKQIKAPRLRVRDSAKGL